ncbi:Ribosome biogenesis protein Urb2 [Schizosaccharomyces pombe]
MSLQTLTKRIRDKNGSREDQIDLANKLFRGEVDVYFPNKEEFIINFLLDRLKENSNLTCVNIGYWQLFLNIWKSDKLSGSFRVSAIRRQSLYPIILNAFEYLIKEFKKDVFLKISDVFVCVYSNLNILYISRSFPDQISLLFSRYCYLIASKIDDLLDSHPNEVFKETLICVIQSAVHSQASSTKAQTQFLHQTLGSILALLCKTQKGDPYFSFLNAVLMKCILTQHTLDVLLLTKKDSSMTLCSLLNAISFEPINLKAIPLFFIICADCINFHLSSVEKSISQQKASELMYKLFSEHIAFLLSLKNLPEEATLDCMLSICQVFENDNLHRGHSDEYTFAMLEQLLELSVKTLRQNTCWSTSWEMLSSLLAIDFDVLLPHSKILWECIKSVSHQDDIHALKFLKRWVRASAKARILDSFCIDWHLNVQTMSERSILTNRDFITSFSAVAEVSLSQISIKKLVTWLMSSESIMSENSNRFVVYYSLCKSLKRESYPAHLVPNFELFTRSIFNASLKNFNILDERSQALLCMCQISHVQFFSSDMSISASVGMKTLFEDLMAEKSRGLSSTVWSLQLLLCYLEQCLRLNTLHEDTAFPMRVVNYALEYSSKALDKFAENSHLILLDMVDVGKPDLVLTLLCRWLHMVHLYSSRTSITSWIYSIASKFYFIDSLNLETKDSVLESNWERFISSTETYELDSIRDSLIDCLIRLLCYSSNNAIDPVSAPGNLDFDNSAELCSSLTRFTPKNIDFVLKSLIHIPIHSITKNQRTRLLNLLIIHEKLLSDKDNSTHISLRKIIYTLMKTPCSSGFYRDPKIIIDLMQFGKTDLSFHKVHVLIMRSWIQHLDEGNKSEVILKLLQLILADFRELPLETITLIFNALVDSLPSSKHIKNSNDILSSVFAINDMLIDKMTAYLSKKESLCSGTFSCLLACCNSVLRTQNLTSESLNKLHILKVGIEEKAISLKLNELPFLENWILFQCLLSSGGDDFLKVVAYMVYYRRTVGEMSFRVSDFELALSRLSTNDADYAILNILNLLTSNECDEFDYSVLMKVVGVFANYSDCFQRNRHLVHMVLLCCTHVFYNQTLKPATLIDSALDVFLCFVQKTSKFISLDSFNTILTALSTILNLKELECEPKDLANLILKIIQILNGLLFNHRSYMSGRFHVFYSILKSLLYSMVQHDSEMKKIKGIALMNFYKPKKVPIHVVQSFCRLLTTWMNPNLMHDSNKKNSSLTDAERLFVKATTKHFVFLLTDFMSAQTVYQIDIQVKELLTNCFYNVYENLSNHEKQMALVAMNAPSKSLYQKFVNDYLIFAKWNEA